MYVVSNMPLQNNNSAKKGKAFDTGFHENNASLVKCPTNTIAC